MPPRFAYWTIIVDDAPTAFRARERAELAGVFRQLSNRHPNTVMKWFAHGKLWDSPEQEREARREAARAEREARGPDWRPGGKHEDPRARFDKRREKPRRERDARERDVRREDGASVRGERPARPRGERPGGARTQTFRGRGGQRQSPHGRPDRRDLKPGARQRKPWERPRDPRAGKSARRPGERKPFPRAEGEPRPKTSDTPNEPEPPAPPPPPGPERPPRPGAEPRPEVPAEETIKILPEPPERAKKR